MLFLDHLIHEKNCPFFMLKLQKYGQAVSIFLIGNKVQNLSMGNSYKLTVIVGGIFVSWTWIFNERKVG